MARQRRSTEERRRQIAEITLTLLAERGARGLTTRAIAEAVGIADGTIFRHFRSKEEIVDAAIAAFESALSESFAEAGAAGAPLERLRRFVCHRLRLLRRRPEILRLALNDRLEEVAGESGAARVRALLRRSGAFVRSALVAAQEQGLVAADVPVELLVWTVTGTVRGATKRIIAGEAGGFPTEPEDLWVMLERLLRRTAAPTPEEPLS